MNRSERILKISLIGGAVYFLAISLAHVFGTKVPGLFIYYNVPSYVYQDTIISFLSFGWAALFYVAYRDVRAARVVVVASFVALAGLANINFSTSFADIAPKVSATPFWIQTALLSVYTGWLTYFCWRSRKETLEVIGIG